MRPCWLLLGIVLTAQLFCANALKGTLTKGGCICEEDCTTSFDLSFPWCKTELKDGSACGQYSIPRGTFVDECLGNFTSQNIEHLDTLEEVWSRITLSATAATGVLYWGVTISGLCVSTRGKNPKLLCAAPCCVMLYGVVFAFVVSSVSSTVIAGLYLNMPYVIDDSIAFTIGATHAIFFVYMHLGTYRRSLLLLNCVDEASGRSYHPFEPAPLPG